MSTTDILNRYLFDGLHVRGEMVQLEQSFQQIVANHDYSDGVKQLLAELTAATCLLTATLKFEGEIAVQIQGDGPVAYMAVNGNHEQQMRGIARLKSAANGTGIKELIGKGNMVITIRPVQGEPYQGIVALKEETLAECLAHYFDVSEQIPTKIWLYTDKDKNKVAGTLVQLLPDGTDKQKQQNDFDHLCQLTNTIKSEEILNLPAQELLHRLYHQEEVRLFEPQLVSHVCGCSEQKCLNTIGQIEPHELKAIIEEQGSVSMTCDYCLTTYSFDEKKLAEFINPTKH